MKYGYMKKFIYQLAFTVLAFGMCACGVSEPPQPVVDAGHNSQNSLDWAGVYAGVIPSASGSGIKVTITLRDELTYEVQYQYIGRPDSDSSAAGTFKWNEEGNTITLDDTDFPPYYKVGENRLTQLDMEGNLITGALADDYVLKKQ